MIFPDLIHGGFNLVSHFSLRLVSRLSAHDQLIIGGQHLKWQILCQLRMTSESEAPALHTHHFLLYKN